jgi:hypothetical protein
LPDAPWCRLSQHALARIDATFEYFPVAMSLCSHVHVVELPLASLLAPPARFVHFASVRRESVSSLLPVLLTTIS